MQRLSIVHVEPTGMGQGGICSTNVARFRVKTAERDRCSIVPPMVAGKSFHQRKRRLRSDCFAAQFGFIADQFPNARVSGPGAIEHGKCAIVVASFMPNAREIYSCDPRS